MTVTEVCYQLAVAYRLPFDEVWCERTDDQCHAVDREILRCFKVCTRVVTWPTRLRVRTLHVATDSPLRTSKLRALLVHNLCRGGGDAIVAQPSPEELWVESVISFCRREVSRGAVRGRSGALTLVLCVVYIMNRQSPQIVQSPWGRGDLTVWVDGVAFSL